MQIALLFMTRGPLPHEDTWAAWFAAAADQLPVSMALSLGCDKKVLKTIKDTCSAPADVPVLQRQRLFDVLIHVGLQNEEFTGSSHLQLLGKDSVLQAQPVSCCMQCLAHLHMGSFDARHCQAGVIK